MTRKEHEKTAINVSRNTILVNLGLSIFKFMCGIWGKSSAMISDGVHSASDVLSTFVVMVGVKLSGKESDEKHPYGHERMECIAAVLLGVILFLTGVGITGSAVSKLGLHGQVATAVPGGIALIAAIVSIVSKELMYWYTIKAANQIHSGALRADAWHHRTDALSSLGSFAGILGAKIGYPVCDTIASLLIALLIMKVAVDIIVESFRKMIDESCDTKLAESMRETVLKQEGVIGIDDMKTRLFGTKMYVDVDIVADGNITLTEAHDIAERVHGAIEAEFEEVKHCMVHVNPGNVTEKKQSDE